MAARTAFPADTPGNFADAEQIIDNDWAAFSSLDTLTDHWSRPGWPDGHEAYYWLLLFGQDREVYQLAQRCQAAIANTGFDLVDLDTLHLTMLRIADAGLSPEQLRTVADAGTQACSGIAPVRLAVGPLAGSRGAIRFSVTPWSQLDDLHRRLHAATSAALNDPALDGRSRFRPHISIAYGNQTRPAEPVVRSIGGLRTLRPVQTVVRVVHLVKLRRYRRSYVWDVVAIIPLDGAHPAKAETRPE